MPKEILHYSNDEVTVVWKPNVCIHATYCWRGLIEVFNPRERPWIKMKGAETEKIIDQVKKCPSGALSYFLNASTETRGDLQPSVTTPALKVEVTADGPYLIKSECTIVNTDGREEVKTGVIALCRCGSSNNKPYCDGTHREIQFKG